MSLLQSTDHLIPQSSVDQVVSQRHSSFHFVWLLFVPFSSSSFSSLYSKTWNIGSKPQLFSWPSSLPTCSYIFFLTGRYCWAVVLLIGSFSFFDGSPLTLTLLNGIPSVFHSCYHRECRELYMASFYMNHLDRLTLHQRLFLFISANQYSLFLSSIWFCFVSVCM